MQIKMRVDGGLGISYQGLIETSNLPDELLKQLEQLLTNSDDSLFVSDNSVIYPDGQQYEITDQNNNRKVLLSEKNMTEKEVKMIDVLTELIDYCPLEK